MTPLMTASKTADVGSLAHYFPSPRQHLAEGAISLFACRSGAALSDGTAPPPPPLQSNDLAGCSTTANLMSTSFENGGFSPFQPSSGVETIVSTQAYRGTRAMEGHFAASPNDVFRGVGGVFGDQRIVYTRWAYKQAAGFNNSGIKKLLRFRDAGQSALMVTLAIHWGKFDWSWDGDSQTWWVDTVTPDQLRGGWHWFEVMNDMSTPGTVKAKVWIDGQLVVDAVRAYSYGGTQLGAAAINGVYNGPVPDSYEWTDDVAISTSCIAAP
jgi:hypothetical protein